MQNGIKQWLEDLDLGKYEKLFSENDIDLIALPYITEEDLKELGVTLGARRKQGRFVVPVEVTGEIITALVDQGDVDEVNSSDLDYVGKAITAAARRGLDLT